MAMPVFDLRYAPSPACPPAGIRPHNHGRTTEGATVPSPLVLLPESVRSTVDTTPPLFVVLLTGSVRSTVDTTVGTTFVIYNYYYPP